MEYRDESNVREALEGKLKQTTRTQLSLARLLQATTDAGRQEGGEMEEGRLYRVSAVFREVPISCLMEV